jgi:YHS domain-containing protein
MLDKMLTPSSSAFPKTVCHRIITSDPAYYPQFLYRGQIIYFCTEACLHAFLEEPEIFIKAHSQEDK